MIENMASNVWLLAGELVGRSDRTDRTRCFFFVKTTKKNSKRLMETVSGIFGTFPRNYPIYRLSKQLVQRRVKSEERNVTGDGHPDENIYNH